MINKIKFRNFILIRELELDFYSHMNVISGETGAGKSVLVGGLNLVLGGTARGNFFFDKTKNVYLEALFSYNSNNSDLVELVNEHHIDVSENELFFVREINTHGKSASYINGRRVTNSIVKSFREYLLDFHSQNEQLNLYDNEYQLLLLDAYGKLDKERNDFTNYYEEFHREKLSLQDLERRERRNSDKIKLYEYQIEELDSYNLRIGEDAELNHEYHILSNAEDIVGLSNEIILDFYEKENSLIDKFNNAINRLSEFSTDLPSIKEALEFIQDSKGLLEDGISSLRSVEDTVSVDTERHQEVEDRIKSIEDIKTKYRLNSIGLVLDYYNEINEFLLTQGSLASDIKKQREKLSKLEIKINKLADNLTKQRKEQAKLLEKEIETNIEKLALPNGKVEFKFSITSEKSILKNIYKYGADEINLFFSANMGMDLQPIKESASGGELSRMLLALKKILSDKLLPKVMVFDEIDVGIGGNTALSIAEFISQIADRHQILCITHLPQVAAKGDNQFKIEKRVINNKTEITIELLDKIQREKEIARMLSGIDSATSIKHAQEILKSTANN